jgi:uncharacterized damage-inducible protein DinB
MSYDVRYPIGQFNIADPITPQILQKSLLELEETPARVRAAVAALSPLQLDTPYRQEGWTVRQVVHHLADSQMNWYIRFRLALTEEAPEIKTYSEKLWAELPDALNGPIEPSLLLIDNLYDRLSLLFSSLRTGIWNRKLRHPERGILALDTAFALFAWHGIHHAAHITELRKRMNW